MTTEKKPMPARYGLVITTTDKFKLPSGTTAQRSGTPEIGYQRLNETLNRVEYYAQGGWRQVEAVFEHIATKTTAYTAKPGNAVPVNTAGGSVTIELPATPIKGDRIAIYDSGDTWSSNKVIVDGNGNKVLTNNDHNLTVGRDFVVFAYTGIASLGWVRESGVLDTSSIDSAIADKASLNYVNAYHERPTEADVAVTANTLTTLKNFSSSVRTAKVTVAFVESGGNATEIFDLLLVKDQTDNVDVTFIGELASTTSAATITVDYVGGMRLRARHASAGEFKTKVLWQTT